MHPCAWSLMWPNVKKVENHFHIQNEFMNVRPQQKAIYNLKWFIFLISGDGSRFEC